MNTSTRKAEQQLAGEVGELFGPCCPHTRTAASECPTLTSELTAGTRDRRDQIPRSGRFLEPNREGRPEPQGSLDKAAGLVPPPMRIGGGHALRMKGPPGERNSAKIRGLAASIEASAGPPSQSLAVRTPRNITVQPYMKERSLKASVTGMIGVDTLGTADKLDPFLKARMTRATFRPDNNNNVGVGETNMDEMARKLTVVRTTPGSPLAPEPHPANYWDEVPAEMHAHIDEANPQDELSKGRVLAAIAW